MENKSVNTKLRQYQKAKEIFWSSSKIQRYRKDIKMLSPYRITATRNKKDKRPQVTSKDLK